MDRRNRWVYEEMEEKAQNRDEWRRVILGPEGIIFKEGEENAKKQVQKRRRWWWEKKKKTN